MAAAVLPSAAAAATAASSEGSGLQQLLNLDERLLECRTTFKLNVGCACCWCAGVTLWCLVTYVVSGDMRSNICAVLSVSEQQLIVIIMHVVC